MPIRRNGAGFPALRTFLLAWAVWLCAAAAPALAERVPGTKVSLTPPPGFTPSQRFPGYQKEDGSSIIVTELPGPASEMQKGMTRDLLKTRGMNLIESKTVKVGARDALLVSVSQVAGGMEFLKLMLIAGDAKETVMIVGAYPKAAAAQTEAIKQSLLSASWGATTKVAPFEGLGFRVDPTPGLKLAGRVANMVVFSESGSMGASGDPNQAILVIGSSISNTSIDDLESFAKDRVARISQVTSVHDVNGRERMVAGLRGYELTAGASDVKTKRPVKIYQLVLLEGGTYYLAQGFVSPSRPPEVMARFSKVTSTFRLVKGTSAKKAATRP